MVTARRVEGVRRRSCWTCRSPASATQATVVVPPNRSRSPPTSSRVPPPLAMTKLVVGDGYLIEESRVGQEAAQDEASDTDQYEHGGLRSLFGRLPLALGELLIKQLFEHRPAAAAKLLLRGYDATGRRQPRLAPSAIGRGEGGDLRSCRDHVVPATAHKGKPRQTASQSPGPVS